MQNSEVAPGSLWAQIADEPVLDSATIDRLRDLSRHATHGPDVVFGELHQILRKDLICYADRYHVACTAQLIEEARQAAHAIKGSSQTAGFRRLEVLAGHLESEAIHGRLTLGRWVGERLKIEIRNALQEFAVAK